MLVGHVTKDGSLAGPRVLEHVVDTVLSFEGDRHHALRTLRALKHRFGPTDELGVFEMTGEGLVGVPDAELAASSPTAGAACPGSVVAAVLEGARPLLVEVQALVARTRAPMPAPFGAAPSTAAASAMLIAVLERRAGVVLGGHDVYASVAGGVRVAEPGIDLAVAMAVAGARLDAVPRDTVVIGELGLGGEVRQVPQIARRLAEAARLGFTRARSFPRRRPMCRGINVLRGRRYREPRSSGLHPGRRRHVTPVKYCGPYGRRVERSSSVGTTAGASASSEMRSTGGACWPQPRSDALHGCAAPGRAGHAAARGDRPHPAGQAWAR